MRQALSGKVLLALLSMAVAPALVATVPAIAQEPEKVDCENATAQMELSYCAEKDFQKADVKLNSAWKSARKAAIDADQDLEADERGAEKTLLNAQRAWIAYRDSSCEAEGYSVHAGSAEGMVISSCKAKLARQRTDDLKAYAEMFQN